MNKKEIAQDFLKLSAKGQSEQAFQLYVGENFRHHNVYFKGDGQTLMAAMEENAMENPELVLEIQRSLEDGNLVAVHSRIRQNPDDIGAAVIHIFQFEDDKIIELWDFGQAVPEDTVNENGMF